MVNIFNYLSLKFKTKTTFVATIALPSLFIIIGISIFCGFFPLIAQTTLSEVKKHIFTNLSWLYVVVVSIFIFFLLFLTVSKYGKIKLGSNDSKPEYSFFSWVAMLFAAGMGIGLMYFGVAEPMSHYTEPISDGLTEVQRAKDAQLFTFFHWGIHAWAIYAVVGLSLSYFAYRYKLPLSLRSALYPMLKDKIHGKAGNMIDIFALCSTFFGLSTTLGFGVVQLNAGLKNIGLISDSSFGYQALIVVVVMSIAIISALTGLSKGVKILSQLNIITAVLLMLFVLIAGPTVYILSAFSEGIGYYMNNFLDLTFNTYAYEPERQKWFTNWTILYWAWWISWSPYVGLFIAKISRGRTIREFIIAVLLLPSLFNFLWMTIFGNSAIWTDWNLADGAMSTLVDKPDLLLFNFLEYLPLSTITSILAIFIICIFFITSADSGIFVMNNIASDNSDNSPKWQNIFWGVLLAVLSLSLLSLGGLESLQTMTLIAALPFAIIMLLFCYNLLKALYIDNQYYATDYSPSTINWTGEFWKDRLDDILTYGQKKDIRNYINTTVRPAFEELSKELEIKGIQTELNYTETPKISIEMKIEHDNMKNFKYGVKAQPKSISDSLVNEENAPQINSDKIFIPVTFFGDGRSGYDIQYFTKDEVISDILKQYERFLSIISDQANELFIKTN